MKKQFCSAAYMLLLLLSCCLTRSLQAQTTCITGSVIDSATKQAIPGVLLHIDQTSFGTSSNALGQFNWCKLPIGKQTILVSCIGYETLKQTIEISENENSPITFVLRSKNIQLREVAIEANDIGQSMSAINRIDVQLRPTNSSQDLLTLVPGLFIAQHAGGGKAEQIFLRGFDADHGTDFFVSVDGMPVNMVSHAHGQGYADFHFVIPETVDRLNAVKGPYNARFGDFTTSGAGEFFTKNALDKSMIRFGVGDFNTWRGLAMVDLLRGKHLLSKATEHAYIAAEYNYSDAYFDMPQHFSRLNVFAKYTGQINEKNILSFSASTFSSRWNASGQIPDRAVKQGLISRFGSISNSEGGSTGRNNVNISLLTNLGNNQTMKHQVYYSFYRFGLFSDFTFFLNDSINGDEIYQQEKGRHIYGYSGSYERVNFIGNKKLVSTLGLGSRLDRAELGLYRSKIRVVGDTTVSGNLFQQSVSTWLDETLELTAHIKMNLALRFDYFYFGFQEERYDSLSGQAQKSRLSPKANIFYTPNASLQFFARAGYGFHSNDARSVILGLQENSLPRALGYEVGSIFKPVKNIIVHVALWGLEIENELVYVGDEGVVEISGATKRIGIDFAARWEIQPWLLFDVDFNYNHGRFLDLPEGENFIPLAPIVTATGGLTLMTQKGLSAATRFKYIGDRPANEANTVQAKGFFLVDALVNYQTKRYGIGLSVENVFNVIWNQAQFDTESRLQNETMSVSELHYTPGTPIFIKGNLTYYF